MENQNHNVRPEDADNRDLSFFIRTRKLFITICTVLVLMTVAVAVGFHLVYQNLSGQYDDKLKDYQTKSAVLLEQNLAYFSGILNEEFTDEQLDELARENCHYAITVNQARVEEDAQILYTNRKQLTISISSQYQADAAEYLPEDVLSRGILTDISDMVKFVVSGADLEPEITSRKLTVGGNVTNIVFDGMDSGVSVVMIMDDALSARLGLKSNALEIICNEEAK